VEFLKRGEVELALAAPLGAVWERLDTWPLFTEPFELIVAVTGWQRRTWSSPASSRMNRF
jgi:hypothetical protein